MPERIDHRSAVVRLLRHCGVDDDCFDSVMFHFDQAINQARVAGRVECVQMIVDQFGPKDGGGE